MDGKLVGDIAGSVIIVGGVLFMVLRALKNNKAKKAGLAGNPTRCIDHSERLLALERGRVEIFKEIAKVDGKVDIIKEDVKTLLQIHLKP